MNSAFVIVPFQQTMPDEEIHQVLNKDFLIKDFLNKEFEEMADCYIYQNAKVIIVRDPLNSRAILPISEEQSIMMVNEEIALYVITFDVRWVGKARGCQ